MDGHYFSKNLDNDRTLYLAPITDRDLERSGQEIDDTSGYFLYETCKSDAFGGVEILARVEGESAALKLRHMLNLD
jgi:hypothetical protein